MFKLTPARILAVIILLYSLVVMLGWIFNIPSLTKILPNQISMQFITAFIFFLSSIGLWFTDLKVAGEEVFSIIVLPAISMFILLLLSTILSAGIFGVHTGITDMFVTGDNSASNFIPGMPSFPTLVSFALFGISILLVLLEKTGMRQKILYFHALPIIIIGLVACLGYTLRIPFLYYQISASWNPMALNTSLMFILLGLGLLLVMRNKKNEN
jgi:hypothetical protein